MKVGVTVADNTETGTADTIIILADVHPQVVVVGIMDNVTEETTAMVSVGVMVPLIGLAKRGVKCWEQRGDVAHHLLGEIRHIRMPAILGFQTQWTKVGMQKPL